MAWGLIAKALQHGTDLMKSLIPARLMMGQDPVADPAAANAQIVDSEGRARVVEALSVGGAAAGVKVGTSGRPTKDVSIQINAVGPKSINCHPLRGGVSVIGANGAAAAISATGKVVTLTAKNDGTTTVTAMLALIAASGTVAPLLSISGTGADTFEATFSTPETALWAAGVIPANVVCALGPDGHNWPVEMDATTGALLTYQRGVNTAVDAQQTMPVVPSPRGVQGPAPIFEAAAQNDAAGSYDMPVPCSNYGYLTVAAYHAATNPDTYQTDVLARIDDSAAPGDLANVNALFLPAGVLGVASVGPTTIQVQTSVMVAWREMVVRRTKVGAAGVAALRYRVFMAR